MATFVLIHGGGSSGWDWHLVAPELADRGHAVVAPDLPTEDEEAGLWDYADAVANAERARRLHPMAPEYYAYVHGQALYAADRRDESATVIAECLVRAPRDANCLLIQAALQGGRGDIEAAQLTIANLVGAQPTFSLESERSYRRFGNKPLMDQFLKDLTRAKAPETA